MFNIRKSLCNNLCEVPLYLSIFVCLSVYFIRFGGCCHPSLFLLESTGVILESNLYIQ